MRERVEILEGEARPVRDGDRRRDRSSPGDFDQVGRLVRGLLRLRDGGDADLTKRVTREDAELRLHRRRGLAPGVAMGVGLRRLGIHVGDELFLAVDAPAHRAGEGRARGREDRACEEKGALSRGKVPNHAFVPRDFGRDVRGGESAALWVL